MSTFVSSNMEETNHFSAWDELDELFDKGMINDWDELDELYDKGLMSCCWDDLERQNKTEDRWDELDELYDMGLIYENYIDDDELIDYYYSKMCENQNEETTTTDVYDGEIEEELAELDQEKNESLEMELFANEEEKMRNDDDDDNKELIDYYYDQLESQYNETTTNV